MNTTKLSPSSSSIDKEVLMAEEYGDEVMLAGWNPQVAEISELMRALIAKHIAVPAALLNADAETFLLKMYEYQ